MLTNSNYFVVVAKEPHPNDFTVGKTIDYRNQSVTTCNCVESGGWKRLVKERIVSSAMRVADCLMNE